MSDEDILQDLTDGADELEQGTLALIALGGADTAQAQPFIQQILIAREALTARQFKDARAAILQGQVTLEQRINELGWWWRLANIHQLPLFAFHVLVVAVLFAVGTRCVNCPRFGIVPDRVVDPWMPVAALVAGGLGAELRGIWFLWNQVSRQLYHRRFLLSQLAAPFTGVLLGFVTYLLAKAGLLIVGGAQASPKSGDATSFGELALCFFVGFKWEWALDRIQRLFESKAQGPVKQPSEENKPGAQ